jgi:hypothetical protein
MNFISLRICLLFRCSSIGASLTPCFAYYLGTQMQRKRLYAGAVIGVLSASASPFAITSLYAMWELYGGPDSVPLTGNDPLAAVVQPPAGEVQLPAGESAEPGAPIQQVPGDPQQGEVPACQARVRWALMGATGVLLIAGMLIMTLGDVS